MSGSVPSLLWTIVLIVIVLVIVIVLLKVVFAIIAIAPYAYAQSEASVIDYGPNGIPAPSWPGGEAPPIGTFGTPNLQDPNGLIPYGQGWDFIIIPA